LACGASANARLSTKTPDGIMSFAFPLSDRYRDADSLVHRLDARVKLLSTLAFIFAATLVPAGEWTAFGLLAVLLAVAVAAGRLPALLVARRSALALPFLLVALPLLFTKPGDTLFTVPAVFWRWHATDAGLTALSTVLAKSLLSVAAAVVLTATTPSPELLRALRGVGVPRVIVTTVSFMYRYLSLIGEEALRLMRARACRSVRVDRRSGGSLSWRARVTGNMVGSLFLRSYERSERVFDAMTARGYDGELRTLAAPAIKALDLGLPAVVVALLIGIEVYARI
jgi:cobalt/nickel transport system permease protein